MIIRRGTDAAKKLGEYLLDVLAASHPAQVLYIQMSDLVSVRTVHKVLDSVDELVRSSDRLPRMALFCMPNGDLFAFAGAFTSEALRQLTTYIGTTIGGIDPDEITNRCNIYEVPDDAIPLRRLIKAFIEQRAPTEEELQDERAAVATGTGPSSHGGPPPAFAPEPASPAPAAAAASASANPAPAAAAATPTPAATRRSAAAQDERTATAAAASPIEGPLDLNLLEQIKKLVEKVDLSPFIQRQPVYARKSSWQTAYTEFFFDINSLREKYFPKVDLRANESLFVEFTRNLDDLMLVQLLADRASRRGRIGLNVALSTVLSPTFANFSRHLASEERQNVICELHWIDLMQDIQDGGRAVRYLQDHGYRVAMDRISIRVLPYLNLEAAAFDHVKVRFDRQAIGEISPAVVTALRQCPPARLVLTECDDQRALTLGERLGIVNYQGRLLDALHARAA